MIRDYGLTELFSESSEPPFDEFPFSEFKRLFPQGTYTFRGRTVEGERLRSTFTLTHKVPDGPAITSPAEDATVAPDGLVVRVAARPHAGRRRRCRLPGARRRRRTRPWAIPSASST